MADIPVNLFVSGSTLFVSGTGPPIGNMIVDVALTASNLLTIDEVSSSSLETIIHDLVPDEGWNESAFETLLEFSGSAGTVISGFSAPSKSLRLTVINNSSGTLTILTNNTGSSETNRVLIGSGDLDLGLNDAALIVYSTLSNKWRIT